MNVKTTAVLVAMLVSGLALAKGFETTKPHRSVNPVSRQLAYEALKSDFLNLPLGKRLTMPLFWLHGEDHKTLLEYVDRIKDGGNGSFVLEPRPHPDWLGPKFWSDPLRPICLRNCRSSRQKPAEHAFLL